MNKMLHFILIIGIFSLCFSSNERKSFKELINIYLNKLDINDAYLSYDQYISLLRALQKDYSDYLDIYTIGKTYEGNDMPLIVLRSPLKPKESNFDSNQDNTFKEILVINNVTTNNDLNNTNIYNNEINKYLIDSSLFNKSGIFFSGMHHGREPVSMMMNIYLLLHILSLPKFYLHLFLSSTNLYFLPIINIDAYKYNCIKYSKTKLIRSMYTRKNRHRLNNTLCSNESLGVDLNRNYPYIKGKTTFKFDPCREEFMGEYPFSEPEIQNLKAFIDTHPNIKIAFNYHTWGNLYITPFNYLDKISSEELLKNNYSLFYSIYKEFEKEANLPKDYLFGNAINTIHYKTMGDATDWFLMDKKILSFSPELGNSDKNSRIFYPNRNVTFDVLKENLKPALYAIEKSMFYLKTELINAEYYPCMYSNKFDDIYLKRNRKNLGLNENLKDIELKNCFFDEIILAMKVRIINRGFGTYHPGTEFNYNVMNDINGDNISEVVENKKYFYFLAFDIKINLEKIKSLCYWTYKEDLFNNNMNINNNALNNNTNNIKVQCSSIKEEDMNNIKIFIDNEIKAFESVILNIQIITKKENFMNKKYNRTINNISNISHINDTNYLNSSNSSNIIYLFTKKDRTIKSQDIEGNDIFWKFNSPCLSININDFFPSSKQSLRIITHNPYRFFIFTFFSMGIMIFFLFRLIKIMNMRIFQDQEEESHVVNNWVNERRALNRNNLYAVDNYENFNRFRGENHINVNVNLEENRGYQIPRDDSESFSNSNSDSP